MTAILLSILANPAVQTILITAIVGATGWLGKQLVALIGAKVKNEKYAGAMTRIADALTNAVLCAEQTVVPAVLAAKAPASEEGVKVSAAEKEKIRQSVWNTTMKVLGGDEGIEKLCKDLSYNRAQFELLLTQMLEATVYKLT